jgi:hypothetical protein
MLDNFWTLSPTSVVDVRDPAQRNNRTRDKNGRGKQTDGDPVPSAWLFQESMWSGLTSVARSRFASS